ncbi:DCC1-like thiol-disulfide oxidoreductase family protein [Bacillus cereus]
MQEITVFYDGWCPFCTKTKRNIQTIDVFHLVNFVSFRDDCVISKYNLSIEALEEMIHSKKRVGTCEGRNLFLYSNF